MAVPLLTGNNNVIDVCHGVCSGGHRSSLFLLLSAPRCVSFPLSPTGLRRLPSEALVGRGGKSAVRPSLKRAPPFSCRVSHRPPPARSAGDHPGDQRLPRGEGYLIQRE